MGAGVRLLASAAAGLLRAARWLEPPSSRAEALDDAATAGAQGLLVSDGRHRALVENSLGMICTHDLGGRLLSVNARAASALGYTGEQMVGHSLSDFIAPAYREGLAAYLDRLRERGGDAADIRFVTREGEERIWTYRTTVLCETGDTPYVLGHAVDVTDARRAEKALQASERQLRDLLEWSQDLIQSVAADGRFVYVNPRWLRVLGYPPEKVATLHFDDLVAPDERDECRRVLECLRPDDPQAELEMVLLAADGRKVHVEGSVSANWQDGRLVATRGFFRDVTERRRLEAERDAFLARIERQNLELEVRNRRVEKAVRLKTEFLATISHDLRTPLNAIVGFSDLLATEASGKLNERQTEYVSFLRSGARHLLELINEILDWSKIEAGHVELHIEDFELADEVPRVLATLDPLARKRHLRIESKVPSGLRVRADRARLKQILNNLLTNAVKFTAADSLVTVTAEEVEGFACVTVSDEGPGVDLSNQDRIFDEFEQAGDPMHRENEGTGLGLAIVRRLVQQHGGKAWVESEIGSGSRFRVLLPTPSAARESSAAGDFAGTPPIRERPLVLVVCDEPASSGEINDRLLAAGYETAFASGVGEAHDRLKQRPDVVVLDLGLYGGRGWGLLGRLARQGKAAVPVVALCMAEERVVAYALGADETAIRPVSPELLVAKVERLAPKPGRGATVMVVDDDPVMRRQVTMALLAFGYRPVQAESGVEALRLLTRLRPSAVILKWLLPGADGPQTLLRLKGDPELHDTRVVALVPADLTSTGARMLQQVPTVVFDGGSPWREQLAARLEGLLPPPRQEVT